MDLLDYFLGGLVIIGVILFVANEMKYRRFQADCKDIVEEGIDPNNPTATPYRGASRDFKS